MKKSFLNKKIPAYSLIELLLVLVIIGILIGLAIPILSPVVTKAKGTEAKLQLKHVQTLEKNYFYEHSKYSNSLEEIDYEHEKLTTEGGSANYRVEIVEAGTTSFKARATAVVDFDGDGAFNVWEIDQDNNLKEVTKD